MDSEIQIALLGILGTLGGTVLGWFLNNLSQHGKLNIFISSWKDKFEYNETGCTTLSSSIEQTEDYSYNVSFDLYNSSGETKIMRNIEILPVNIPPKSIMHIELHNWLSKSDGTLDNIWNTTHIYLKYINEKNRKKKILIRKEKYKDYFINHIMQ